MRILHLAFHCIVWPTRAQNHKDPPPRHTHTLAVTGIGAAQFQRSSYKPQSLSFGTLYLNNANTMGRQKNRIFHVRRSWLCSGSCFSGALDSRQVIHMNDSLFINTCNSILKRTLLAAVPSVIASKPYSGGVI